jgi:hypothetical protein
VVYQQKRNQLCKSNIDVVHSIYIDVLLETSHKCKMHHACSNPAFVFRLESNCVLLQRSLKFCCGHVFRFNVIKIVICPFLSENVFLWNIYHITLPLLVQACDARFNHRFFCMHGLQHRNLLRQAWCRSVCLYLQCGNMFPIYRYENSEGAIGYPSRGELLQK